MKDRVVCIDAGGEYQSDRVPKLVKGDIYTVVGISIHHPSHIILLEIGPDWCYLKSKFRPVDESFGEWVEETIMKEVQIEELINT